MVLYIVLPHAASLGARAQPHSSANSVPPLLRARGPLLGEDLRTDWRTDWHRYGNPLFPLAPVFGSPVLKEYKCSNALQHLTQVKIVKIVLQSQPCHVVSLTVFPTTKLHTYINIYYRVPVSFEYIRRAY